MPKPRPKPKIISTPGPDSNLVAVLQEICAHVKVIASGLSLVAQSTRDQAENTKVMVALARDPRGRPVSVVRGPVITRISRATYDQKERAQEAPGSEEVPGFRRR